MRTWPELPYAQWKDTLQTLHLWTQIVGKYRLAHTPWLNHSWHATFYVSARGLTSSTIAAGERALDVEFDFIDHALVARASDGARAELALAPISVAEFHARFLALLRSLNLDTGFHGVPNEIPDPIPFAEDTRHAAYDADAAHRFWQALVRVERVLKLFRTGFLGKSSPVHLFWGALDLAVTRFSGRPAPEHPGGVPALPDAIAREAYSHEVSSAGFWPGGGAIDFAAFYAYAYPEPDGFAAAEVAPAEAYYEPTLGEFLLPYDAVRASPEPEQALLRFLQSSYAAAADLGGWDRAALDCPLGEPRVPRPR